MIVCPRCASPVPDWLFHQGHVAGVCNSCRADLDVYCFPALYRAPEAIDLSKLALTEGDSCCYEHASKRASSLCSHCGRFLCALCEVSLGGQTLCPDCVQAQPQATQRNTLETDRVLYDSIALALATWPLFLFYFCVITAPLSLGIAIWGWKRPGSLVRRGRWRFYAAIALASLELLGIIALVISVIYAFQMRPVKT